MENMTEAIMRETAKAISGKDDIIKKVLTAILAGGHVLLEDVPGVGKTTLARAFARALGLEHKRIQFTPDTMPSDITGYSVIEGGRTVYREGAVMTNLLLADEINRTSAKTQSALLEAMAEGSVTVDGVTHALEAPFTVIATQNPLGSAGTLPLPNSQLDRFMLRLSMGYPDMQSQLALMKQRHHEDPLDSIKPVVSKAKVLELIDRTNNIHTSDKIYEYIAALTEATRHNENVQLGMSPRGMLCLMRASKAAAFIEGRDHVLPKDVTGLFKEVCCHRLVLSQSARLRTLSASDIAEELLASVPEPKYESLNI